MSARGFTLVELMVASSVGAVITLAGVAFVSHQTRLMGVTSERIEMNQASRFGLERLRADLRMAGVGIGYDESGGFSGLEFSTFSRGGAQFTSDNRTLNSGVLTDDLGILIASGGQTTIAGYNSGGLAQFCAASGIKSGSLVVFRSEDGLSARSAIVTQIGSGHCSGDVCSGGCDDVLWAADPAATYASGANAIDVSYLGGTATGDLRQVTWFVEDTDPAHRGEGRLRRVVGDCSALDYNCGEVMAERVESMQIRRYARKDGAWTDITDATTKPEPGVRLRVDVELVVRARAVDTQPHEPTSLLLETGACVPSCTSRDSYARKAVRASVEIKNSGRNQYWRGR
ncbi:MAG: prepilin-type N-terminal cleavage/methylation domain-containing protein [Myxococcota bacterium]